MRNLYLILFILVQSCFSNAQTFEGVWQGELVIQGQKLPLIFELQRKGENWAGSMQSPAQSLAKIPMTKVSVSEDSIWIEVKNIGLSYRGAMTNNNIKGIFRQGGFQTEMTLQRASQGERKKPLVRSQIVEPPYSYDTAAVVIRNTFDNVDLAGTITFPKKKGKYPAVLLLTGSGPQNRDEEIFDHKPFRVLSDYLTKAGIVVLRVDDRGVGESKGDFASSTIENFSKDAISAFNYLRKQPQVDPRKVGIIGHSEGGLIAELLAGQRLPGLSFIVSLAGPSFSIDQLMVEQLYAIGKAAGMSKNDLAQAQIINKRNFAVVKSDLSTEEAFKQLLQNMSVAQITAENKQLERELLSMLTPAYRYFMRIEPERYISQIKIPMFAAFGSLDVQVPADSNLKSLHDLLPKNSKSVLKEYEGMNHLFQKAKTGQVSEYFEIEETINPQVMKDITEWIKTL